MVFRGADFTGADLRDTDFRDTNLGGAIFNDADLRGADLRGAIASRANFKGATLGSANLIGATLEEADLRRSDLSGANLTGANLRSAELLDANLTNLTPPFRDSEDPYVCKAGTNFTAANLREADVSGATLGYTIFANVDLSRTRGLGICQHAGPSSLDYEILLSTQPLPDTFLHGCGVPAALMRLLPTIRTDPSQYYSCFISYSHEDDTFVKKLYGDLQRRNVRCWFAPEELKGGEEIPSKIDLAIRNHDKLLLVLSENSMKSDWVAAEIKRTLECEIEKNAKMLFPVRLVEMDAINNWSLPILKEKRDVAAEIRNLIILDFERWDDDDYYNKSLDKLLKDLKF